MSWRIVISLTRLLGRSARRPMFAGQTRNANGVIASQDKMDSDLLARTNKAAFLLPRQTG